MIKKNSLKMLFNDDDICIPVTIFNFATIGESLAYHRSNWLGTITDTINLNVGHNNQILNFHITCINGDIYDIRSTPQKFMDKFRKIFSNSPPFSLRIDIMEDSDRSWIILLKTDI